MAKMKAVSGIVHYVKDTAKTADFYEKLGFVMTKREADHVSVRLNWFWMDFHPQDMENKPEFQEEANMDNKGAGLFLYVSVDDVDEFYKDIVAKGFKAV